MAVSFVQLGLRFKAGRNLAVTVGAQVFEPVHGELLNWAKIGVFLSGYVTLSYESIGPV
jgi:hypothetical protein